MDKNLVWEELKNLISEMKLKKKVYDEESSFLIKEYIDKVIILKGVHYANNMIALLNHIYDIRIPMIKEY